MYGLVKIAATVNGEAYKNDPEYRDLTNNYYVSERALRQAEAAKSFQQRTDIKGSQMQQGGVLGGTALGALVGSHHAYKRNKSIDLHGGVGGLIGAGAGLIGGSIARNATFDKRYPATSEYANMAEYGKNNMKQKWDEYSNKKGY